MTPPITGSVEKKKELLDKEAKLETQREELIAKLERAYERADNVKKQIFDLDQKLKSIQKEIKRCYKTSNA
jgi:peptidoglycan hydrolase CwlO-like protein